MLTFRVFSILTLLGSSHGANLSFSNQASKPDFQSAVTRNLIIESEVCEENGVTVTSMDTHYKAGAIDVLYQAESHVTFTVEQVFDESEQGTWMSVVYKHEGGVVCNQQPYNPAGYKRSFQAMCDSSGVASIDVYVQSDSWSGSNQDGPSVCASWPSASPKNNVELFSYRLECGECDGCTIEPAQAPTSVSIDPDEEFCEGQGVSVVYHDPEYYEAGAIDIIHQGDSEVIFTLSQVYSDAPQGSMVNVVYKDADSGAWTCDSTGELLPPTYTTSFKAQCEESGTATVDVYVHNGEWTADHVNPRYSDRPGECANFPYGEGDSASGVALFSYALSCGACADCETPMPTSAPTETPTAAPTSSPTEPTGCPGDLQLISVVGETMYPKIPIVITSQDSTSVSFSVEQTWTEKATIYTQMNQGSGDVCFQEKDVSKHDLTHYTAQCLHSSPVALIQVWAVADAFDGTVDIAEVPECCHPDGPPEVPVVQYTFLMKCETACPVTSRRNLRGAW